MIRSGRWTRRAVSSGACFGVLLWASTLLADDSQAACIAAADQAQELRSAHKLTAARAQLIQCAASNCPTVIQSDCAQWLAELDAGLPSVVIRAYYPSNKDAVNVRVSVDGVVLADRLDGLPLAVDPGVHVFRYELSGMLPVQDQVVIRVGEKNRPLIVQFRAVPVTPAQPTHSAAPSSRSSWAHGGSALPYVLAGVGVVALGSFAYFGLQGTAEADRLANGCGETKSCRQDQVDPVRSKLVVADISLAIGVVSLGMASWLYLSNRSAGQRRATQSTPLFTIGQSGREPQCAF